MKFWGWWRSSHSAADLATGLQSSAGISTGPQDRLTWEAPTYQGTDVTEALIETSTSNELTRPMTLSRAQLRQMSHVDVSRWLSKGKRYRNTEKRK